jgi:hypothetical protein
VKLRVSKVDAAIRMLFDNGDPVAIHTLAAAGGRILRDLCEQKQTPNHLALTAMIRPGKEKEFHAAMNRAANFFKHADKDADEVLDGIDEKVNDSVLMMALMQYQDLGLALTAEMHALHHWYAAKHPDGFVNSAAPPQYLTAMATLNLPAASRPDQLQMGKQLLQMVHQIRGGQLGHSQ